MTDKVVTLFKDLPFFGKSRGDSEKVSSPMATAEKWDLVIRAKTGWFDLHLSDLWRYRDLTLLFVWRDFIALYKQTILGPLWHLIQPLFTTALFTLIFGRVAKLST